MPDGFPLFLQQDSPLLILSVRYPAVSPRLASRLPQETDPGVPDAVRPVSQDVQERRNAPGLLPAVFFSARRRSRSGRGKHG